MVFVLLERIPDQMAVTAESVRPKAGLEPSHVPPALKSGAQPDYDWPVPYISFIIQQLICPASGMDPAELRINKQYGPSSHKHSVIIVPPEISKLKQ